MAERKEAPPFSRQVRLAFTGVFALVLLVFALKTFRVATVSGEEIGFLVNNWTGRITEIDAAGQVIYCGLWNDFLTLEKGRLQEHMAGTAGKGEDFVKIKTIDGNDVFVDLTIQYQIDPRQAATILRENGGGRNYQHWVRDYARAICRYDFGELKTEEFFVASLREPKAIEARDHLNELLKPHGIRVTQVLVQNFHFRKDYDDKIREKNLAEQEAERWKSQQQANLAALARLVQQAKKETTKQLAAFQGELDKAIAQAQGRRDKVKLDAEAYAARVKLEAEANFHKAANEAQGLLAAMSAEAAGMRALREALSGDGGRALVALEYAKRLAGVRVAGRPVLIDGVIEQFSHEQRRAGSASPAASAGGGSRP
jgi:regulator of protease activity HflC (stomatin/prohibitin superfamily)